MCVTLIRSDVKPKSLTITGHADRLGDGAYNDRLSLQRVNTVRAYLQGAGVNVPMHLRDEGEREPVSGNTCVARQRKVSLIACLQRHRRVVADIEGGR